MFFVKEVVVVLKIGGKLQFGFSLEELHNA